MGFRFLIAHANELVTLAIDQGGRLYCVPLKGKRSRIWVRTQIEGTQGAKGADTHEFQTHAGPSIGDDHGGAHRKGNDETVLDSFG